MEKSTSSSVAWSWRLRNNHIEPDHTNLPYLQLKTSTVKYLRPILSAYQARRSGVSLSGSTE